MTVSEIFAKIASHMIKGLMTHEQLANYYDFLGLKGYKRCHEYHYLKESCSFRKLNRYFVNHHNKLVPNEQVEDPKVIPESWYKYTRQDVDNSTKRSAVKNGIEEWVRWERETKKLYEQMYKELIAIDEIASAMFIKSLVEDVDCELKYAERKHLDLIAIEYDLSVIIPEQECIHEKYKEKELDKP